MTNFKVGDTVRLINSIDNIPWRSCGGLEQRVTDARSEGGNDYVQTTLMGPAFWLADRFELVRQPKIETEAEVATTGEKPMTKFQVGDVVRLKNVSGNRGQREISNLIGVDQVVTKEATADNSLLLSTDRLTEGWDPHRFELVKREDLTKETRVVDPKTGGTKGQKDVQLHHLAPEALAELGRVSSMGADKYAAYNYLKGYAWSLSFDAMQRHMLAFWGGQDLDPESGRPHVAHAAWHALALCAFMLRGIGTDDRPPRMPNRES